MKILLTNDDGYESAGLELLHDKLSEVCKDLHIMAPSGERSTSGHSLNLDKPLRVKSYGENKKHCSGFPADCVLLSLGHFHKKNLPDLVVSGINKGANLSQDIYYSATVAGAREAVFHGVNGIAVSLACKFLVEDQTFNFDTAAEIVKRFISAGINDILEPRTLLNINVPNIKLSEIKGIKLTNLGFRRYSEEIEKRVDGRNRDYYWIVGKLEGHDDIENSDCQAILDGYVSVSLLPVIIGDIVNLSKLEALIKELNRGF